MANGHPAEVSKVKAIKQTIEWMRREFGSFDTWEVVEKTEKEYAEDWLIYFTILGKSYGPGIHGPVYRK